MINNELTSTPQTRHGIDPSTEEPLPEVPVSGKPEVDRAVAAAKAALPAWRSLSWDERESYLLKLADAIEANSDDFRDLDVADTGKALQTSAMEIGMAPSHLRTTASLRIPDEVVEQTPEKTAVVRYRPLGVCECSTLWCPVPSSPETSKTKLQATGTWSLVIWF